MKNRNKKGFKGGDLEGMGKGLGLDTINWIPVQRGDVVAMARTEGYEILKRNRKIDKYRVWDVVELDTIGYSNTLDEAKQIAELHKQKKELFPSRKELPNIHAEINQAQAESQRKEGFARRAYFVQHTVINENGEYIPCIAVEGERGYHMTDWAWGKDYKLAEECANKKNEALGIDRKQAMIIVLGTMRPAKGDLL